MLCSIRYSTALPYPTLPYPTLPYPTVSYVVLSCPVLSCPVLSCPVLSCPVPSCPVLLSPHQLPRKQSGDYGEETYSICTCINETGNCWDLSLWSTEGKTYEDYIRLLTSSLIRDCYAQRRKLRENIRNGNFI